MLTIREKVSCKKSQSLKLNDSRGISEIHGILNLKSGNTNPYALVRQIHIAPLHWDI